jgi:hypothetical protein
LNFAMSSEDLFAIFMIFMLCFSSAFWSRDINVYLVSPDSFPDQPSH